MELIAANDSRHYNALMSAAPHAEFLQSWEWGEFQDALGKKVWRWKEKDGGHAGQAHSQPLPAGFSYIYWPRAVLKNSKDFLQKSIVWLFEQAHTSKPLFLRVEPVQTLDTDVISSFLVKMSESMQPADTTMIDLRQSEEALLRAMKSKTRYNIHLAEKKGVTIIDDGAEKMRHSFFELCVKTQQRHGVSGHSVTYLQKMMETIPSLRESRTTHWSLLSAVFKEEILASALFIHCGDTVTYLHGGSSDQFQNVMAPYLLHWTALRKAKQEGYRYYDFFGIAPESNDTKPGAEKRRKKWSGITRFKLGFGGNVMRYPGTYDIVFRPAWYRMYKLLQGIRSLFIIQSK